MPGTRPIWVGQSARRRERARAPPPTARNIPGAISALARSKPVKGTREVSKGQGPGSRRRYHDPVDPSAERVLADVEELGVRFVRLWFTDVLGFLKSFAIPSEELERGFREGIGFDGSAIEGFARLEEADMLARPDADSFRILPWPEGESVGRMLCDVTYPDGAPFEGDPRHVLKRNLARAGEMGYSLVAGPEVEFFLSRSATSFEPLDRGGYFDLTPAEVADDVRKRAASALDALGVRV